MFITSLEGYPLNIWRKAFLRATEKIKQVILAEKV